MKKLMMQVPIRFKMKTNLGVLWALWLVLAVSECYVKTNARSYEIVETTGFVTWITVVVMLIEMLLLFTKRYLYFPIATIFFHLSAVLPLIEMFALNKIAEVDGSIVYVREPDGGYITSYLMEITTVGYICIVLSFILMLLHFCLSVKMSEIDGE